MIVSCVHLRTEFLSNLLHLSHMNPQRNMTGRNNVCAHARAACDAWSAGSTNTVNLYGFLPVRRENVNTSWFSAKVELARKVMVFKNC